MKTIIIVLVGLMSVNTYAHDDKAQSPTNSAAGTQNVQYCNQEPCKTKTIYMTYKQEARIKALEAEVARLKDELKLSSQQRDTVVGLVEKYVEEKPLNSVSLIVPYFTTDLKVTESTGKFKAETAHEADLGLMYQRTDFLGVDNMRATGAITATGGFLLGLGLDF